MQGDGYTVILDGEVFEHYECEVGRQEVNDAEVSPFAYGVTLIENYVSRILGRDVRFFLFDESRVFLTSFDGADDLVLDISICETADGDYRIIADMTSIGGVMMEIAGRAVAVS